MKIKTVGDWIKKVDLELALTRAKKYNLNQGKVFFSFEMFHGFKNLPQNYRFVTSSLSFLFIIQHVPAKCQKSCLKNLFSRPIIITNLWADTAAGAPLRLVNGCYCTNSFLWSTLHKTSGFQHPVIPIYHIFC